MKLKVAVGITLVVALIVGAFLFVKRTHSRPSVTATLHIAVAPPEQLDFVAGRANSAMFKYMMSKDAGVAPALARSLEVKAVPNSALLEAKVRVMTREEGQRFAQVFVESLQGLCGKQAQLTLAEQLVR